MTGWLRSFASCSANSTRDLPLGRGRPASGPIQNLDDRVFDGLLRKTVETLGDPVFRFDARVRTLGSGERDERDVPRRVHNRVCRSVKADHRTSDATREVKRP